MWIDLGLEKRKFRVQFFVFNLLASPFRLQPLINYFYPCTENEYK